MIFNSSERARLLIDQRRFKEAEDELRKCLSSDPSNPEVFSLLCICKWHEGKYDEAEDFIKSAISLAPANPYLLYIYSKVLLDQEKLDEAEKYIIEAITMDPLVADFFGLRASIFLQRKNWELALHYANKGLAIEPDNLGCLNIRSTALLKLDRKEESYSTIHEALHYDPENPITHSNLAWGLLEKGDHKKALAHFTKALQIDPELDYAKHGLVESLKARYWIYRMFLKYAFWIGNMKSGMQWGIILGFFFGSKALSHLAKAYPALNPFILPIIVLYVLFAISTWIIGPITNLFLRLNVYGRYALTPTEIQTSNFVGVSLCIGLTSLLTYPFFNYDLLLYTGIFGLSMMIPLSGMLVPAKQKQKRTLIIYTSILAIIGVTGLVCFASGLAVAETLGTIYLLGIIVYQWISNAMLIGR
jgi:tetratricopeptide (TPR) repeat protein